MKLIRLELTLIIVETNAPFRLRVPPLWTVAPSPSFFPLPTRDVLLKRLRIPTASMIRTGLRIVRTATSESSDTNVHLETGEDVRLNRTCTTLCVAGKLNEILNAVEFTIVDRFTGLVNSAKVETRRRSTKDKERWSEKTGMQGGSRSEARKKERRKHCDVNRNDNDYRRSYPGTSFLNDYAVENYCA